jgi:CRISPR/Cas system Type II protein with McrA/HNH and RuvC-like nuclease domain
MTLRTCRKCNEKKPLTTEYYNLLSGGTWRWSCKACMAASSKKHHHENPEMTAARRERYKQNLRAAPGVYTQADITTIRVRQRDACYYCNSILRGCGEVDHRLPLSRGGSNWPINLVLACVPCNRDKNNKTDEEFFEWRVRLGLPCSSNRGQG